MDTPASDSFYLTTWTLRGGGAKGDIRPLQYIFSTEDKFFFSFFFAIENNRGKRKDWGENGKKFKDCLTNNFSPLSKPTHS